MSRHLNMVVKNEIYYELKALNSIDQSRNKRTKTQGIETSQYLKKKEKKRDFQSSGERNEKR